MKYRVIQTLARVSDGSKPEQSFAPNMTEAKVQFDGIMSRSGPGDFVAIYEKSEMLVKGEVKK